MAFFDFGLSQVIFRFSELVGAPFQNPSVLWLGLPLIITIIAIESSLHGSASYKEGFSHAFPNAIVLFFVAIDMIRVSVSEKLLSWSLLASLIVLGLAAAVFLIDYYKEFPSKKLFGFSAHLPINTLSYALFVVVYNKTGFDVNSIVALLAFMVLLVLLFFLVLRMDRVDYSDKPRHKDIWQKREKRREVEIAPRKAEDGDVADPFRGVKGRSGIEK